MENYQLTNVKILPRSKNPVFDQRETGVSHTSYLEETAFYSLIQSGNVGMVKNSMRSFLKNGIVVGHLSDDGLRQMKYWGICCVTLGTRYAIQGGLDEMTAYNVSDEYIMNIDKMKSCEEIAAYLGEIMLDLASKVSQSARNGLSPEIQRCINYIDKHLHEKITLDMLAGETGYSKTYLSRLFKAKVGKTVSDYILAKKLDEAKTLLRGETEQALVAYYLGFCSQTYFIKCFKAAFGLTPSQYRKQCE